MKNWGFVTSILGILKHAHLPVLISFSNPQASWFAIFALVGLVLYFSGIFLLVPNLVSILLPWKVPHLLPEALTQGYLTRDISWLTAIKGLLFLMVLWTIFREMRSNMKR